MSRVTFFVYLDALRLDYISNTNMPFLATIGQKGHLGRVKTVSGFTQEAAMMTGKFPIETDHFTWYRYAPETHPFYWVRPLGFLRRLPNFRLYDPLKVGIRTATRLITGEKLQDPARIPLDLLPYFENISSKMPNDIPNLISICHSSGRRCLELMNAYSLIKTKRYALAFQTACKSIQRGQPYDLYLMHIGELDGLGHQFGPRPEYFLKYLHEIDAWIRTIYSLACRRGHTCNLVIVSDHGMAEVQGTVNIADRLDRLRLKLHKDYFYFLDSTMARFWFMTKQAQEEVEAMLQNVPHGHIVTNDEKEELHINFTHNRYGDMLFWLDEGFVVFPSFFHGSHSSIPKGMHGYMGDSSGALIVYSDEKDLKGNWTDPLPLVEVFSIARDLVNV